MGKSQADATVIPQSDASVTSASTGIGKEPYADIQRVDSRGVAIDSDCLHKKGDSVLMGGNCKFTLTDVGKQLVTVEETCPDGVYTTELSGDHFDTFGGYETTCTWKKPFPHSRGSAKDRFLRSVNSLWKFHGDVGREYFDEPCTSSSRRPSETKDC